MGPNASSSAASASPDAERWTTDLKRGGTKLAILSLIRKGDRYGYEIVAALAEHGDGELALAEGNVYPALHALEREGVVASYWREMEPGVPPRKYYRITTAGIRIHDAMVEAWTSYHRALTRLLNGGGKK